MRDSIPGSIRACWRLACAAALALGVTMAACTKKTPSDNGNTTPKTETTTSAPATEEQPAQAKVDTGKPATTEERIAAIEKRMVERGWNPGDFKVARDGPEIGAWQTFMAFTINPSGTLLDVWAGPRADRESDHIIVSGEPLTRPQLRALLSPEAKPRDVAHIVVRTAGHGTDLGDPETGSSKGAPGPLEGKLRAPGVDQRPDGDAFVFDARTRSGGYVRVTAALSGDAPVELDIQPIQ